MSFDNVVIKTVALAGTGGHLGRQVLDALLREKSFDVTVLTRQESKLIHYPTQVQVVTVDYGSPQSLQDALRGVDAVVSTLGKMSGLECQFRLIDAAVAAGVKRFIPSEFGADLQNPKTRAFLTYRTKVQVEEHLEELARETNLTYTYVYNSLLFDDSLALGVFGDFTTRTVNLYDGGETAFSTTRITTVARAVVAVLRNFEATKNRAVRIRDLSIMPRELLHVLQRLDAGHRWTPVAIDTRDLVKEAEQELGSGKFNPKAFAAFATRATFAPEFAASYSSDNELLGITELQGEELDEILRAQLA